MSPRTLSDLPSRGSPLLLAPTCLVASCLISQQLISARLPLPFGSSTRPLMPIRLPPSCLTRSCPPLARQPAPTTVPSFRPAPCCPALTDYPQRPVAEPAILGSIPDRLFTPVPSVHHPTRSDCSAKFCPHQRCHHQTAPAKPTPASAWQATPRHLTPRPIAPDFGSSPSAPCRRLLPHHVPSAHFPSSHSDFSYLH